MSLDLPDDLLAIVTRTAAPLPRACRHAFERAVIAELSQHAEIGPGLVHRIAASAQRQFWEPPRLERTSGMTKWAR
jgi:hypothetical protein